MKIPTPINPTNNLILYDMLFPFIWHLH
jgi:hypothetical protein